MLQLLRRQVERVVGAAARPVAHARLEVLPAAARLLLRLLVRAAEANLDRRWAHARAAAAAATAWRPRRAPGRLAAAVHAGARLLPEAAAAAAPRLRLLRLLLLRLLLRVAAGPAVGGAAAAAGRRRRAKWLVATAAGCLPVLRPLA